MTNDEWRMVNDLFVRECGRNGRSVVPYIEQQTTYSNREYRILNYELGVSKTW